MLCSMCGQCENDLLILVPKPGPGLSSKCLNGEFSLDIGAESFDTDVELLLESLQEEAIDLKCDSRSKRDSETMKLEEFWVKYLPMYLKVGEEALRSILPFSSIYLCEAGFSALVVLKTKQRNRLDVENNLRCALSSFNPRISDLVRKKQQHPSH
ncbi:protein FAM200C-like [Palaemon carinicauda]|uniref:protein FAM200C-like n=1 Tax=Palaemon carinicauda TaxID=392227 RepID=UPI0035B6A04A